MVDRDALREPPSGTLVALRHAGRGFIPVEPSGQSSVAVGPGRWGGDPAWHPAAERTVDQYPVSRAKVTPPPLRDTTLSRDRLLDWLEAHVHRRCVTVVAETGFGKTTLLADFTRRTSARCLWYRLDTGDRDPISFANYLVAAGQEAIPSLGVHTLALLRDMLTSRPATELIISTLIAEMTALGDRSTILVLDDYHVVDEDPRARALVTRLLAEAPDRMSFVLLSRRPPRLALGRLVARGEAPHLDADDLRFSADETERLFRDVYHQPLEPEVLHQVEVRTEGWAAGLQLLHSSIRGRSPRDVRSFVDSISGAQGPLYDYLAEEVLADFEPEIQRFLTYCSILDDVTIELAQAIFATDDPPASATTIQSWAEVGHRAGLMTRHSALSTNLRYHPLMREFLERRLGQLVTPEELRGMHLRVARVAEATDWLASCRHYIKAGCEDDALRVLAANATKVLGSGQWGDGAELIHALRASDEDPRIAVILAREDIYGDRIEQGLSRLERFDLSELDGPSRGLVVQARVHALWWLGRVSPIRPLLSESLADPDIPCEFKALLSGVDALLAASRDGLLADARRQLEDLLSDQEGRGLVFYQGITRHNLMHVYLAQGDLPRALESGYTALELFGRIPQVPDEAASTRVGLARVLAEEGRWRESWEEMEQAIAFAGVGWPERRLEAAGLLVSTGDLPRARDLVREAHSATGRFPYLLPLHTARMSLAAGSPRECLRLLAQPVESVEGTDPGAWLEWLLAGACAMLTLREDPQARDLAKRGADLAQVQGAEAYRRRFRLLLSILDGPDAIGEAIEVATDFDLLITADPIAANLHRLADIPPNLHALITSWPGRWLPLLRRALADANDPAALPAALLLDEHGELSDVRFLRGLTKGRAKSFRGSDIGRGLARRLSPIMIVHDLGRTRLEVGSRSVSLASMRRRAAGLLCLLLTRKNHVAPRDQVLEALWPDFDPGSAVNSLNQTLYFLRRDIEPSYDDDFSAQYVHFESDLVWLDRDLVSADSAIFHERLVGVTAQADLDQAVDVLNGYHGRFAPEFEYEEWASAWRDLLHGQYLHLSEHLVARLIAANRMRDAADLAVRVLRVDPTADHLERELIWLYSALGARSAAAEQYGHYAEAQRTEYGVEPPPFEVIATER